MTLGCSHGSCRISRTRRVRNRRKLRSRCSVERGNRDRLVAEFESFGAGKSSGGSRGSRGILLGPLRLGRCICPPPLPRLIGLSCARPIRLMTNLF